MINLAMKSKGAIDSSSLSSINTVTCNVIQAQNISSINKSAAPAPAGSPPPNRAVPPAHPNAAAPSCQPAQTCQPASAHQPAPTHPAQQPAHPRMPLPPLRHPLRKGQKAALSPAPLKTIKACLGWNTASAQCDVDVSAFLLDGGGKVPGDSWFVFYGQKESPDHSTVFRAENSTDRESITIHLDKLNPDIKKIVFVLTIHEALEKKLNFGMVSDAYIRILDAASSEELASFLMTQYYANVVSMMIGELYNHNGIWKFNAVGNGVAKDLSDLCGMYGVQVDD